MERIHDRRTSAGSKLRIYMESLRLVESITTEQWVESWAKNAKKDSQYLTRDQWIEYLKNCIIREATQLLDQETEVA